MFCERSEHACTRPRLVLLERLLFTFIVSMVVLPEDSTDHYFQFCRMRVSLRSVGTKKTSKNHVSPRGHYCGGLVYLAGTVLWVGGLRAVWIPGGF